MKSQDKETLTVLRMVKGAMQLEEINKKQELNDEDVIAVLSKQIKTRKESIVEFEKAGREDLVNEYKEELEVLQTLLPKPVTKEEITECIRLLAIEKNWTFGTEISIPKKEMGTVIRQVKSEFPSADGKVVSEIVKSFLE
jgi:uncharacterized protein YqeY